MTKPANIHDNSGTLVEIPGVGILQAYGNTVPADGLVGYAPGCLFLQTDATTHATCAYVNHGTITSCNFDAIDAADAATVATINVTTIATAEAGTLTAGTTTGFQVGTAAAQKLGFWGATPVIQQASANQAALGSVTTVGSNNGTAGTGLSLIGATNSGDVSGAIMNDLKALQEDIAALFTLVAALRTALVNVGIVKGAA